MTPEASMQIEEEKFTELNIDKRHLEKCFSEYCNENSIVKYRYIPVKDNHFRAEFEQIDKEVKVDFYFKENGTTTIMYKVGKNHENGLLLAKHLKEKLLTDERKNVYVSVKGIDSDIFDCLIEEFENSIDGEDGTKEFTLEDRRDDAVRREFKITSLKHKDSINIHFYKNKNSLLIQGKPLYTYYQISCFMSEYADINGFLNIIYMVEDEANSISVDVDQIDEELRDILANSYDSLGDALIKMLTSSYTLKDISIPLPDYTCYVFPALRALEGVVKKLLYEKDITRDDYDNSFKNIFVKLDGNRFEVNRDYVARIRCTKTVRALNKCYTYYYNVRNRLFHADDYTDGSLIIEDKKIAAEKVENILKLIDSAYKFINS